MLNTCQICQTPTLFSKNRYCETCANNVIVGTKIMIKGMGNDGELSGLGYAEYHKDKNLGGEMQ